MTNRRVGTAPCLLAFATLLATAPAVDAQHRDHRDRYDGRGPTAYVGVALMGADPVGDFGAVVDQGFGAVVDGAFPLTPEGAVRLRADAGFLIYGRERKSMCFSVPIGCRIGVDLTTSNQIFFAGIGPELTVPNGPVRPYVNATAGFSYFTTTSSLSGFDEFDDFADTRNFEDFVGALTLGGGIRVGLRGGTSPISLDLGVQYHRNGVASYLTEGDIVDHPDGSITIFPNRSEANLLTYRIGVRFGVGGGGDDTRRRR